MRARGAGASHPAPSPPGHPKRVLTSQLLNSKQGDGDDGDDPLDGKLGKKTAPGRSGSARGPSTPGGSPKAAGSRKRRGASNGQASNRPRKKTWFSCLVGGLLGLYFLFMFALQPVVDVESAHHNSPRGAHRSSNKGGGGNIHHSPMMLLREREAHRRKIKEQQQQLNAAEADDDEEAEDKEGEDDDEILDEEGKPDEDEGEDGDDDDEGSDDEEEGSDEEGSGDEHSEDEPKLLGFKDEAKEAAKKEEILKVKQEYERQKRLEMIRRDEEEKEDEEGFREEAAKIKERRKGVDKSVDRLMKKKAAEEEEAAGKAAAAREAEEANAKKEKVKPKQPRKRILPVVPKNAQTAPVEGDPLRATDWPFEHNKIDIKPAVEYLGTLVDGGRHYFPMDWLKRMVDRLADMNFNLIHFRLTDDQTFNVLLKSRPELAYPQAADNPSRSVYSVEELKEFTAYAKARGIQIMPEVNVPGHAGGWAGIKDMIVHCPKFICEKGYGLPLNVTHRDLKPILTDIIKEMVEIFDDPPFLHLGGDEVNMADPCFKEVGSNVFDYPAFEQVLKQIIKDSGYPEERVVRWEMTGQKSLDRAGGIEQFWESHPGDRHEAKGEFFVSTWMYFDTNTDQNAYEVYTKADKSFHLKRPGQLPKAIIAGTFELSCEFWYDRNVLGRLLSVAIGAAHLGFPAGRAASTAVIQKWKEYCTQLGFGDIICDTDGGPVIATRVYHMKWRKNWETWKTDICNRLTETKGVRTFKVNPRVETSYLHEANKYFWKNFPLELPARDDDEGANDVDPSLPREIQRLLKHRVPHTGVILDLPSAMPKINRLHTIINEYVAMMGFNLVQLRLVNNYGFVYESETLKDLGHSLIAGSENPLYSLNPELEKLVQSAHEAGVEMMPEVSVSTDAGGWYRSGFLANCPDHYCIGEGTPIDINNEGFPPVLFSVIGELRQVFTSRFVHLGTDEREASAECFAEAKITPKFDVFEKKIETLMALANLSPEEIIRTENREGVRYADRAGVVTQFRADQPLEDVRAQGVDGEVAFVTIDLFQGDGYDIFESTKKAVATKPLGILAELRKLNESKWKSWKILKRLLAFAMGLSEIGTFWSIYNADTFAKHFTGICEALKLDDTDCSPPGTFDQPVTVITESQEFVDKSCEVRTTVTKQRVAKKADPYFKSKRVAAE